MFLMKFFIWAIKTISWLFQEERKVTLKKKSHITSQNKFRIKEEDSAPVANNVEDIYDHLRELPQSEDSCYGKSETLLPQSEDSCYGKSETLLQQKM